MRAADRRSSILAAARRAFSETGDVAGTTIKVIAERGGISEGVIYRHFDSKEQLFYEAVVEPLKTAVDDLVTQTVANEQDIQFTPELRQQMMSAFYKQLVGSLEEVLPLLGLVLFGDPEVAQRFYRENLSAAMERLATVWGEVERRHGFTDETPDVSARAVMGMALMLALESRHAQSFDRQHAITTISAGTLKGFFPTLNTADQA
jgi:AcrR family transcriptional regulator